jgi:hypothetical protein
MADTNIIGNLFGVSPELLQTQQENLAYSRGSAAGNNLLGGILGQTGMFTERVGSGLQSALGVQSPEQQMNAIRQQASQQFDTTSPEGMLQYAQFLNQQGDAAGAQQAVIRAQAMAKDMQAVATSRAQQLRAEREPGQVNFQQLLSSGKYTPASIAKFQQSQNPADLVLVKGANGEGGAMGAGPVGKSGAYRDADGIIYSASEMAKQRLGFQGLEKLADNLNSITATDIKNAESMIDYTQGETRKSIGGTLAPKTIAAQSKINASQLLKQIEALPPGSASNADMVAAKSSFPGYGDAKNLEQWVKDTKSTLDASMKRQAEQYGFKQKVVVTGISENTNNINQEALDWVKANPNDPRTPAIKKKLGI